MKDWTDEERKLFEESRRLKEKARGLVAKRHAQEEQRKRWRAEAEANLKKAQDELKAKAEEQARKDAKALRDSRIRRALLDMAEIVKRNNLAFKAPGFGMVERAFVLIDKGASGTDYNQIVINTTPDGFQWN